MYVVFQIGNKQYSVYDHRAVCCIDRINKSIGDQVEFNQVLFLRDKDCYEIGSPFLKKIRIIAIVIDHFLGEKIRIIKFRRRKHFRKIQGHRQRFTKIKIIEVIKI